MKKGKLFVLSGPSGAGKGTICNELVKEENVQLSISMTTRAIRGNEIPDVSYYFVSDEKFDRIIARDGFLEYAAVYGHRYGTPKKPVLKAMSKGKNVILEIEMQGASNVKNNYEDAVLVFILPPSLEVLRNRLAGRNSDSAEQIRQRTEATLSEIRRIFEYDYYIVNDDLYTAVETAKNILKAMSGDEKAALLVQNNKVDENVSNIIEKYEREAIENAFISVN